MPQQPHMMGFNDLYYAVTILSGIGLIALGLTKMVMSLDDPVARKEFRKGILVAWVKAIQPAMHYDRGTVFRPRDPSPTPRRQG